MDPQNIPPNDNQPDGYQDPQVQVPEQQQTLESPQPVPPSPSPSKAKILLLIPMILIVIGLVVAGWFMINKNNAQNSSSFGTELQQEDESADKVGIESAVNRYCEALGIALGTNDLNSGYIISLRFTEEELRDSPELLLFRKVGNAASATVDCERSGEPIGISNDLLFVKQNDTWDTVDEVQNYNGSGFLCSVVDEHQVSKELVTDCAPSAGAPTQPR